MSARQVHVINHPLVQHKLTLMRRYFDLMRRYRNDHYALFQMRRRVSWIAKRLGPCRWFREEIRTAPDAAAVYASIDRFIDGGPATDAEWTFAAAAD